MGGFKPLRVAIVGCGNISFSYVHSLMAKSEIIKIVGAFNQTAQKARFLARVFGGYAYDSLDDVVNDSNVEAVVNLTSHASHAEVSAVSLSAGKHVYSEKPLATTREDGKHLIDLAEKYNVRLACAPANFLGEAQETIRKAINDGIIGRPLITYADINIARIELWHPNPEGFYQIGAGPMLDVGVYAITLLTTILGSVTLVEGNAHILLPERTIGRGPKAGKTFHVTTPDHVTGFLKFASGTLARVTASFFGYSEQNGAEFHGEKGSLILNSLESFGAKVFLRNAGDDKWYSIPHIVKPFLGVEWGRGLFDLAESIRTGTPQRCTGQQSYHVLDICLSILDSAKQDRIIPVKSSFSPPPPKHFELSQ